MMSTAKKLPPIPEQPKTSGIEIDTDNDWRHDKTLTNVDLTAEGKNSLAFDEEELDPGELSLDLDKEFAKKAALEHSKELARKLSLLKRTGSKTALEELQRALRGEDGASIEGMDIISEEDRAIISDPIFTNKGDDYPQIHGSYFLLDHLVDGGMAKICRARYLGDGEEAADKMVVIKMVQEKFSDDEDFVQMFVDEIKVSFGLNHPNINTTFDYGKIGKNLFVSMEYIHGKDLMVLIDELKKQGRKIPVPMALFIASKMCEALHYAHNFTNQLTGQKYNIVHRDISPHNAMISYEGFVKVIDFGIAKADTNTTKEEEGTIKGKINYFAPEYLEGKKIDHRYDQFAVALTLWEMLTGEKTFKSDGGQIETLKLILACNPSRPSLLNQEVTDKIDQVVLKALSRDPANRYEDMIGFSKELLKILYVDYSDFHESDVSELMREVFKESYERDLEKFREFGKYPVSEVVAKINAYKEYHRRLKENQESGGVEGAKGPEIIFDFGFEEESVSARGGGGMDSLIQKAKKGKKASFKKQERRAQKRIASMLGVEVDEKPEKQKREKIKSGPFPFGKVIIAGVIALVGFQYQVISHFIQSQFSFSSSTAPIETSDSVRPETPGEAVTRPPQQTQGEVIERPAPSNEVTPQEVTNVQADEFEELSLEELERQVFAQLKEEWARLEREAIERGEELPEGLKALQEELAEETPEATQEDLAEEQNITSPNSQEPSPEEEELIRRLAEEARKIERGEVVGENKNSEATEEKAWYSEALENTVEFLKTRKAFSWLFNK